MTAERFPEAAAAVDGALDRGFLLNTLTELAHVPNAVEPGFDTLMEPTTRSSGTTCRTSCARGWRRSAPAS